jgi:protein SCO1
MQRKTVLLLLFTAALAGAVTAWIATRWTGAAPVLERATLLDAARPLPQFALVDQAGRAFNRESLRGHWTLMFFGFTNCPDICPTTLATLAEVRRLLKDLSVAEQPTVAFVTVDPARDTPEVLGHYVAHFDDQFVGATGTPGSIEVLTRGLGVAAAIVATGDDTYTVDHTAAIFLIDPDAAFAAVFGSPHAAAVIARDYRSIIAARD